MHAGGFVCGVMAHSTGLIIACEPPHAIIQIELKNLRAICVSRLELSISSIKGRSKLRGAGCAGGLVTMRTVDGGLPEQEEGGCDGRGAAVGSSPKSSTKLKEGN